MKKLLLPMIIICLLLSGCSNGNGNDEPGGEDRTANVIVNDVKTKLSYTNDDIKIVKLNDSLYYEVDEENEINVQQKADGELKNSAGRFEIPKQNGECNFKDGKQWRKGTAEDTIEVFIEDDWEIFKKISTNSDVSKYKYCYVVEGILPNAKDDSEFLVLANDMDITFEDASYKMLGSDLRKMKDIYVLPIVD